MSDSKSGDKHPQYGKSRTEATKRKLSGEKSYRATITDHTAKMIKIRIVEGIKDKLIQEEFNTTQSVVSGIRHGRSWKHVTV